MGCFYQKHPATSRSFLNDSATFSTGTNFDQISQRDTNQTTGRRWLHNVGESISLFVAGNTQKLKTSLKLIAAKGKVQMQAQSDEIEITGDKNLTLTSAASYIQAQAQEHITLTSGGGYIRLQGGNIEIHCPGTLSVKAANYSLTGPTSMSVPPVIFPQPLEKQAFSQRLDWDTFPVNWLPVNQLRQTEVLKGKRKLAHLLSDQAQPETRAALSITADDLRYMTEFNGPWTIEETIDNPISHTENEDA